MQYCKHTGDLKRCAECLRPLCQRNLLAPIWEDVIGESINDYRMHDLYSGV